MNVSSHQTKIIDAGCWDGWKCIFERRACMSPLNLVLVSCLFPTSQTVRCQRVTSQADCNIAGVIVWFVSNSARIPLGMSVERVECQLGMIMPCGVDSLECHSSIRSFFHLNSGSTSPNGTSICRPNFKLSWKQLLKFAV